MSRFETSLFRPRASFRASRERSSGITHSLRQYGLFINLSTATSSLVFVVFAVNFRGGYHELSSGIRAQVNHRKFSIIVGIAEPGDGALRLLRAT